jgi:hypothetical protein
VIFADLDGMGNFDLIVESPTGPIEVECKTVTEDTGSQIKVGLNVDLSETFRTCVLKSPPVKETGLFVLTFKKPTAECRHFARHLKEALRGNTATAFDGQDFSLQFAAKPNWQALLDAGQNDELRRQILADPVIGDEARCIVKAQNHLFGLVLRPHKPTTLSQRVIKIIKEAADQCSRQNPCIVWLHFVGLAERDFVALAEFSSDGKGAGLNALVANALHPDASSSDRTHVERIRFSASPDALSRHPAFDSNLLLSQAVSVGGTTYDVPNPYCRTPRIVDI